MPTLENRSHTALLVIDVQNGVVEGAHERDAVVASVAPTPHQLGEPQLGQVPAPLGVRGGR